MAMGQDKLTFYGVLAAIVIAVVGYFQIGKLYPVTGHPEGVEARQDDPATPQEDAEANATRPEEVAE